MLFQNKRDMKERHNLEAMDPLVNQKPGKKSEITLHYITLAEMAQQ